MPEERLLEPNNVAHRQPVTRSRLVRELAALGLTPGMTVIVHASLANVGWVPGGAQGVIEALLDALGDGGTLVMPAHTGHLSDPARWQHPPVPESWWEAVRAETPAYDPARTPTRGMGAIAETFRSYPGVLRSAHPQVSFAALGPNARAITAEHPLGDMFGERSPLARLYDLGAWVLLLGVDHGRNTSLHLGEHRADFAGKTRHTEGAPMVVDGRRRWVTFEEWAVADDDFAALGRDFAAETGAQRLGAVGWGEGRLAPVPELVDYAERWIARHR